MSSVPVWSPQCDDPAVTPGPGASNTTEGLLESAIHQHQSLYELMCLNYTEVCNGCNGKTCSITCDVYYRFVLLRFRFIRPAKSFCISWITWSNWQIKAEAMQQMTNRYMPQKIYEKNVNLMTSFVQTYPRPKPWPLSSNPAQDYSKGASHVLAVIHQILNHHR